jgi:tocopherol cyclase
MMLADVKDSAKDGHSVRNQRRVGLSVATVQAQRRSDPVPWSNLLHPERYQGANRRYPYFEGWYYKLVDASETHRYAVIPGIYRGPTPESSQSFVQFLDGATGEVTLFRYPAAAFRTHDDAFEIQVGPNRFTRDLVELHLQGTVLTVEGKVDLLEPTPWPSSWHSPGIMGWFSWIPFMECYHGIVSLDHHLRGELLLNAERVDLSGGRGYTEKDWGRRFPAAWVWFQSNHLGQPGTCLTASVAVVPWLGAGFTGFIIGLWHAGQLYCFATYTGARIERLDVRDESITWAVSDRAHRLEMEIARTTPGLLYAPDLADMTGRVGETLNATAHIRLTALGRGRAVERTVFDDVARLGGLEVVGDPRRLVGRALE